MKHDPADTSFDLGGTLFPGLPAGFGKFIAGYTEKWGKVIRGGNIKPQAATCELIRQALRQVGGRLLYTDQLAAYSSS
jgi:hypothetical protein